MKKISNQYLGRTYGRPEMTVGTTMDFTGNQADSFNPGAHDKDRVVCWSVAVGTNFFTHTPTIPVPLILAESWGATIGAGDAVETLLGAIPYYYNLYTDVRETPIGVAKAIRRMKSPESLYESRLKRIKRKLKKTDPLFYEQMVAGALMANPYTLEWYRKRQKAKRDMMRTTVVGKEDLGRLWINPDGAWLARFDWVEIRARLSKLAIQYDDNIYQAWDAVTEMYGIYPESAAA